MISALIRCLLLSGAALAASWHLDVQSRLVENWNDDSSQPRTVHMIVINAGEKMDDSTINPLNSSQSVTIVATQDLNVLIPDHDENMLEKQVHYQFRLNDKGRFSFVVPVQDDSHLDLPELLVRLDSMEDDQWVVVRPAHDFWNKFSKLDGQTLQKSSPELNSKVANSVAGFVSKLSVIAKSAKLDLDSKNVFTMNSKYNENTNRLPSFVINGVDVNSVSSVVSLPLEDEYLVSSGALSKSSQKSIHKRDLAHIEQHPSNVLNFYSKVVGSLNTESGLNFSDITNAGDMDHLFLTSEPKSKRMVVSFQKRGLVDIYHSILDKTAAIIRIIVLVLQKVGIFIMDLLKHMQSHINWPSISRTTRFLIKFHRVNAHFQSYAINFTHKRFENLFSKGLQQTQNGFDWFYSKVGAQRVNQSMFSSNIVEKAKSSIGLDNSTSTGDARVNFLQDRILASMDDLAPVNDVSFRKNIKRLFKIGGDMGKELLKVLPKSHKEKLRSIVLTFDDDSFFAGRFLARAAMLIESLTLFVESVASYLLRGFGRFLNVMIQISTTLLELPVYIPVFSRLWKRVIAPGTGEMSLLSIYCLIGGIPANLFYQLYRGREPFSVEDISALETVKLPQLFRYTWNNHMLTRTKDPHELKRRDAVMDWILKMSGAYITNVIGASAFAEGIVKDVELSQGKSPDMIAEKYARINNFFSVIRWLGILLIMIWIYPFSQLDTLDPIAIENDLDNPDWRVITWWSGMQIGIATKLVNMAMGAGPALNLMTLESRKAIHVYANKAASVVQSLFQTIAVGALSRGVFKSTNFRNWKRTTVSLVNNGAFYIDTLNQYSSLLEVFDVKKELMGTWAKMTASGLAYAYELRAHLMMGLHVVGIFAPPNETLADHKP